MIFAATPMREVPSDGLLVRDPGGLSNQTVVPEASLDVESIQGMVISGFNKDFRQLISLRVSAHGKQELSDFKAWLRAESAFVATAAEVIAFNRLFKATRQRRGGEGTVKSTWMGLALSHKLLDRLTQGDAEFADRAFTEGLAKRSAGLGDPVGDDPFAPSGWLVGGEHNEADLLVVLEADDRADLDAHADRLNQSIAALNHRHHGLITTIFVDEGENLPPPLSGHEHFGFLDGISQPGLRGLLSHDPTDPLTLRQNPHKRDQPEDPAQPASAANLIQPAQGKPGQDLLHPGEFVFGYPRQTVAAPAAAAFTDSPNPLPGPDSLRSVPKGDGTVEMRDAGPDWARDGSFMVYRRLRQDVGAFHDFLFQAAKAHLTAPLAHDGGARYLGSQLVGRWPSGCPVLRSPDADLRAIGDDDCANNNFEFGGPTPDIPADPADPDACVDTLVPHSAGDTTGALCPFNAHIRKAYPRDDESLDVHATLPPNESDTQTHRLLRRGLPYGPVSTSSFDSPDPAGDAVDRGLQFICFQTSIENQFEFVIKAWVNNLGFKEPFAPTPPADPAHQGGGLDPILGQRRGGTREFNVVLAGTGGTPTVTRLSTTADWVHPTGGAYLFAPSLAALEGVLTT